MEPGVLALLVVAAGTVGGLFLHTRRTRRAWKNAARELALTYRTGGETASNAELYGVYRGVPVWVRFQREKSFRFMGASTALEAFFSIPIPPTLRSRFLATPVVREALGRLEADQAYPRIDGGALMTRVHGWKRDPEWLRQHLNRVVEAVRRIEDVLQWTPPSPSSASTPDPLVEERQDVEPFVRVDGLGADPPPGPPVSVADALVAELSADGTAVSTGAFTLDPKTAREKMRRFQLSDSATFVLPLVRAGVLLASDGLSIDVGHRIRLVFDCRDLSTQELDRMWSSLFQGQGDRELLPLQQLALGLNGAFGFGVGEIRLHTGSCELRLAPAGDEERLQRSEKSVGVVIELRQIRWTDGDRDSLCDLIRDRCRHSEVPIRLGGDLVSVGMAPEDALVSVPLALDGARGVASFEEGTHRPARVEFLRDGVRVGRQERKDLVPGLCVVVEDPRVRVDLGLSEVVGDAAVVRILRCLPAAERDALRALAERTPADLDPQSPAAAVLRAGLRHPDELGGLEEHRLWQTIDGGVLSSRQLLDHGLEAGELSHADGSLEGLAVSRSPSLLDAGVDPERTLLLTWYHAPAEGQLLVNATGTLRSATDLLRQRAKHEPSLHALLGVDPP